MSGNLTQNTILESQAKKRFMTFSEILKHYETREPTKFLWNGVKEKTFGLVFGQSKSGKTIFCENLAISLAIGSKEFFGFELDGKPKKVLFAGLEEFWENRAERNKKQFDVLNEEEKKLMLENYVVQELDFSKFIKSEQEWEELEELIRDSNAEVVFIDSITRMNHGKLEDSNVAEKIMQRLRNICYDLKITLVCIHHTPKIGNSPITMDSIKGSAVFAQESDFAIGINKSSKGNRYMKDVYFRYAPENHETVLPFEIDSNLWCNLTGNPIDEDEILNKIDGRVNRDNRNSICDYLNSNSNQAFTTSELVTYFKEKLNIKERQIKSYLKDLVEKALISSPSHGNYRAIRSGN